MEHEGWHSSLMFGTWGMMMAYMYTPSSLLFRSWHKAIENNKYHPPGCRLRVAVILDRRDGAIIDRDTQPQSGSIDIILSGSSNRYGSQCRS